MRAYKSLNTNGLAEIAEMNALAVVLVRELLLGNTPAEGSDSLVLNMMAMINALAAMGEQNALEWDRVVSEHNDLYGACGRIRDYHDPAFDESIELRDIAYNQCRAIASDALIRVNKSKEGASVY